jgi:hypothetical protein
LPGVGPQFEWRFYSVWVSRHLVVRHIQHLYTEGAAGSDHAPVVMDLAGPQEETSLPANLTADNLSC